MPRHGVVFDGREHKLQEVASQIPFADKKAVRVGRLGRRCYWYFSKRMRIATVSHPAEPVETSHRVVLEGSSCDGGEQGVGEQPGGLGSASHVVRMLKVYRHRWTGTETFHRDAKQQLGLGDCQVRSGKSLPRT